MDKNFALNLIEKTKEDYNKISAHFSSTRKYNWPDIAEAINTLNLEKDQKVADLGCGNGRLFEVLEKYKIKYFGLDISEELIEIATNSYPEGKFVVSDILETPYKKEEFSAVISIAALHHIPSKELRRKAIKEIHRIVKPGGKILISVWYFWNKPEYTKLVKKDFIRKILGVSQLDKSDFMMPWKTGEGEEVTARYFHAWKEKELINELKKVGFSGLKVVSKDKNLIITGVKE